MDKKKETRGGSGRNQGRKPIPPELRLKRYLVRLRPEQIEWLQAKPGDASALLRELIDKHFETIKKD